MSFFLDLLKDPFIVNKALIGIYFFNCTQFLIRGYGWDSLYWLAAGLITVAVTNK
jgi:hypothetical protein